MQDFYFGFAAVQLKNADRSKSAFVVQAGGAAGIDIRDARLRALCPRAGLAEDENEAGEQDDRGVFHAERIPLAGRRGTKPE